jgi:hypothetical protein
MTSCGTDCVSVSPLLLRQARLLLLVAPPDGFHRGHDHPNAPRTRLSGVPYGGAGNRKRAGRTSVHDFAPGGYGARLRAYEQLRIANALIGLQEKAHEIMGIALPEAEHSDASVSSSSSRDGTRKSR